MKGQVSLTTVALAAAVIAATAAGVYVYSSQSSVPSAAQPVAEKITEAPGAGAATVATEPSGLCDGAWASDDLDPLQVIIDSVASTGLPPEDSDYDCADINGDGSLTSDDSTCLAGILAGMYTSLGECPRCTADSALEVCHDGVDNNCDGQTDRDTYDEETGEYSSTDLCSCTGETPCQMKYDIDGVPGFASDSDTRWCRDFGSGYRWYSRAEGVAFCDVADEVGKKAYCDSTEHICGDDLGWHGCWPSTVCDKNLTLNGDPYWCRDFGDGWGWYGCANCGNSDACQKSFGQATYTTFDSGTLGRCLENIYECKGNSWKRQECKFTEHCNIFESGGESYWCIYDANFGWSWEKCEDCDKGLCESRSDYDPYIIGVDYMPQTYGGEQADPQRERVCGGSTAENPLGFEGSEWDYKGYFYGCCNETAASVCGKCPGSARYGPEFDKTCNWACTDFADSPFTMKKTTTGCEDVYSRWEGYERLASLLENKDSLSALWNGQEVVNKFKNSDIIPKRPLGPDGGYLGFYDSLNPADMRTQIDLAQQYGVDFFAFVWGAGWYNEKTGELPPFRTSYAADTFMQAVRPGRDELRFVVNWVLPGVEYANLQNTGDTGIYAAVTKEWLGRGYLDHPNYFKIRGKPVIYIMYWKEAVDHLEEELGSYSAAVQMYNKGLQRMRDTAEAELGVELYIVGAGTSASLNSEASELQGLDLDAFTAYLANGWVNEAGYYSNVINSAKTNWEDFYGELKKADPSKPYYPTMSNDIFINVPSGGPAPLENAIPMVKGSTPSTFYTMAMNAKDFVDKNAKWYPKIIMDYAWSEWGENNVLEPTVTAGYDYLEVIENVFGEGLEYKLGVEGVCTEGQGAGCDGMAVSSPFTVVVEGLDTDLLDNDTIASFRYCPSADADPDNPGGSCSAGWSPVDTIDSPDGGYAYNLDLEPGTYDIAVNLWDQSIWDDKPSSFSNDPLFYLELWNENSHYWIDDLVVG